MINQERIKNLLLELCAISSPSRREGKVAEKIKRYCEEIGAEVEVDDAVEKVGGNNRTAAGHVLDDEVRISGNMFAEMLGDESCVGVISAPGGGSRDNCDCFSLIKIGLRWVRPQ